MARPRIYSDEQRRERALARATAYAQEHPEKVTEAKRRYVEAHPERVARSKAQWRSENLQYFRLSFLANRKRYMLLNCRRRAAELGIPFDLCEDDIETPEFCPVLGIKLNWEARGKGAFYPDSPSIDRVVPALGYVASNIRVISNRANILKRDATAAELRAVADYIEHG